MDPLAGSIGIDPLGNYDIKGVHLVSGPRMRSANYTIKPSRTMQDMGTGFVTNTPALRARFKEHKWHSASAEMIQQYEEYVQFFSRPERPLSVEAVHDMVANYMINHKDFGRVDGRGLSYDSSVNQADALESPQRVGPSPVAAPQPKAIRYCQHKERQGEDVVSCPNPVYNQEDEACDFCEIHGGDF
jgi:hypothetical protein